MRLTVRRGSVDIRPFAIKCNRIWPCLHCKNRSTQRECRFIEKSANKANERSQASASTSSETAAQVTAKGRGAGSKRRYDSSDDSDSDYDSESDLDMDGGKGAIRQYSVRVSSDGQAAGPSSTQTTMVTRPPPGRLMINGLVVQSDDKLTCSLFAQTRRRERPQGKQYMRSAATCIELQTALDSLPAREHVGM